jgi:hypothetical protein
MEEFSLHASTIAPTLTLDTGMKRIGYGPIDWNLPHQRTPSSALTYQQTHTTRMSVDFDYLFIDAARDFIASF